ncbi:MAG: hypothetical protein MJ201_00985 [Mycoplasmoidaceae bacterium]|nr:hypothetical protein [Mycoplasmoidaceae bacterium]
MTKAPGDDCFRGLFEGSNVSSVDQNLLKRFYLSDSIFASMFEDCSDLIKAPDLPNTISEYDDYCYSCMFKNCISLECAPDLMCAEP